ncbi:hypothetical protein J14TS2_00280 [Bacillus sp. J14TS2]|nr:hypothetical protein J14TS2_00280 [Bacillus sp. J14TS2]
MLQKVSYVPTLKAMRKFSFLKNLVKRNGKLLEMTDARKSLYKNALYKNHLN